MESNYLDFGSESDSDRDEQSNLEFLDSDEEEARENAILLKMMTSTPLPNAKTKREQDVENFEAEMDVELTRRAEIVENSGGVQHQKFLSKASSTPLKNLPPATTPCPRKHLKPEKSKSKVRKSVRFAEDTIPGSGQGQKQMDKVQMYDNIYFDSDNEEEQDGETKSPKNLNSRKIVSDEDLFYDPNADDNDQEWMDKQRNSYFNEREKIAQTSSGTEGEAKRLPNSDAVLNCPACFTVLSVDCQRHQFYQGQFRAMFVMNCEIITSENRFVPSKAHRFKNRKRKSNKSPEIADKGTEEPESPADTFHPVKCKVCHTEVAVYDTDEVYHFFNVLTSHC